MIFLMKIIQSFFFSSKSILKFPGIFTLADVDKISSFEYSDLFGSITNLEKLERKQLWFKYLANLVHISRAPIS